MWTSRTRALFLFTFLAQLMDADPRCVTCHPKETAGFEKSAMGRSLAPVASSPAQPDGAFEHVFSKTQFAIRGNSQSFERGPDRSERSVAFVIGSGAHAFGYLVQMGDHMFQSPLSYYTKRAAWDVAPGYENDPHPDFSRPVTPECLSCHSGQPLPIAETLNQYQPGVFAAFGITCERCHGDTAAHLRRPVKGTILNPANLTGALRDSICEQCHLTGEMRIPNPGRAIADFKPGGVLEDFYTTYVAARASGETVKVVSHAEQLALSECARKSGGKLWCGTCHNPHDAPTQPAAYFRERCLSCHAASLNKAHAAPGRDCVACHMPQLPASDGGHTAFTNHRIARPYEQKAVVAQPDTLSAWRQPVDSLRDRNLALALVTVGMQNQASGEVIRGYKMLNQVEKNFIDDPAVLTSIGAVLMKGKQPAEALQRFQKAELLKPAYAPYHLNAATAFLAVKQPEAAVHELQNALDLDPLFQPAVRLLAQIYREQSQAEKADDLEAKYNLAMGVTKSGVKRH